MSEKSDQRVRKLKSSTNPRFFSKPNFEAGTTVWRSEQRTYLLEYLKQYIYFNQRVMPLGTNPLWFFVSLWDARSLARCAKCVCENEPSTFPFVKIRNETQRNCCCSFQHLPLSLLFWLGASTANLHFVIKCWTLHARIAISKIVAVSPFPICSPE